LIAERNGKRVRRVNASGVVRQFRASPPPSASGAMAGQR
jgi:hypothetical protein